jgi:phytoene synthase
VELRPAFDALLGIDDAMAEAALTASQPALGAIKLAWWREALEKLDAAPPPPEPRLRAAASELLPRGLPGRRLAELEDGWLSVIDGTDDPARIEQHGRVMFALAGDLLGRTDPAVTHSGASWALADVARRTGEPRYLRSPMPHVHIAKQLRPLTMLSALAVRDQRRPWPPEPEATPQRAWTILRHRLTGKL